MRWEGAEAATLEFIQDVSVPSPLGSTVETDLELGVTDVRSVVHVEKKLHRQNNAKDYTD